MNYELLLLPHPDAQQFLFNILNFLMNVDLAIEFTYTGKVTQNSFKTLHLCEVVKSKLLKCDSLIDLDNIRLFHRSSKEEISQHRRIILCRSYCQLVVELQKKILETKEQAKQTILKFGFTFDFNTSTGLITFHYRFQPS